MFGGVDGAAAATLTADSDPEGGGKYSEDGERLRGSNTDMKGVKGLVSPFQVPQDNEVCGKEIQNPKDGRLGWRRSRTSRSFLSVG